MAVRVVAAVLVGALAVTACGGGGSPTARVAKDLQSDGPDATTACLKSAYLTSGGVLRAAFVASGAAVSAWQLNRWGPAGPKAVSQFVKQHAGDARLFVCYADSDNLAPPSNAGMGGGTSGSVVYEVALDGTEATDMVGPRQAGPGFTDLAQPHP